MNLEEIKEKKQSGDMKTAAKMAGISQKNAFAALNREGSKYHNRIIEKLSEVITLRENLINESKKQIQ